MIVGIALSGDLMTRKLSKRNLGLQAIVRDLIHNKDRSVPYFLHTPAWTRPARTLPRF